MSSIIKKKNTPLLRFKRENGEKYPQWEDKLLENIVVFFDGKRKPLEKGERKKGIYPYYGASGIIDYVDNYIFDEELILLSEDGANIIDRNYRVSFLATGKYWVNNHAHVLKGKSGYNNYFICESLERLNYEKYNSGTAQPKLNQEVCKKIKLKIPSSEEQEKIAAFLTRIDNLISTQESNISILETYNRGLISKIFKQEIRFKNDNGNEFPTWAETTLSQIAMIYDGTHQTPEYVENGIPFVSVENIKNLYNTQKYITDTAFQRDFKVYPEKNDILMTRIGDIGTASVVSRNDKMAYYVSLALLKLKQNVIPNFLVKYIASTKFQKELWKRTLHIAFPQKINKGEIGECIISLPCLEEQEKTANFLTSLDNVLQEEKNYLEYLKTIKKGLLQQMFV